MATAADSKRASRPRPILAERFKTKMCEKFLETGECPYEARCMFAHGDLDLRTKEMNLHDNLTTEEAIKAFQRARVIAARAAAQKKATQQLRKEKRCGARGDGSASPKSLESSRRQTTSGPLDAVDDDVCSDVGGGVRDPQMSFASGGSFATPSTVPAHLSSQSQDMSSPDYRGGVASTEHSFRQDSFRQHNPYDSATPTKLRVSPAHHPAVPSHPITPGSNPLEGSYADVHAMAAYRLPPPHPDVEADSRRGHPHPPSGSPSHPQVRSTTPSQLQQAMGQARSTTPQPQLQQQSYTPRAATPQPTPIRQHPMPKLAPCPCPLCCVGSQQQQQMPPVEVPTVATILAGQAPVHYSFCAPASLTYAHVRTMEQIAMSG